MVVPSIGGAGPFTDLAFAAAVDAAAAASDDIRVALVPAQVSRLLSSDRGIGALQRCTSILVGGRATRPSLRAAATDLGITLTTTYGATETAGGCVFDGRPLPGVTVTADGDAQVAHHRRPDRRPRLPGGAGAHPRPLRPGASAPPTSARSPPTGR